MGDKKQVEEWYEKINTQFEGDKKSHDYSDPKMDEWFAEMLDKKMSMEASEERYNKINRQFEEDRKNHDYSDPDMDRIFSEMLDNQMREDRKRKITKVASVVAGIVVLSTVALSGFTQVVYGESLLKIVKNSIEAGKFTITSISQNDDSKLEKFENEILSYENGSIEEIFGQIIKDDKTEIDELFCITDLPKQYQQWNAKYNKILKKLTISSQKENDYFYIYEKLDYENVTSGTILESKIVSTVYNKNLQININVIEQMENMRLQGYCIEVFYNNKYLLIEGNGTLEEFENIAKNISIQERG